MNKYPLEMMVEVPAELDGPITIDTEGKYTLPDTKLTRHHFSGGNEGMVLIKDMKCFCGGKVFANERMIRCGSCTRAWPIKHKEIER